MPEQDRRTLGELAQRPAGPTMRAATWDEIAADRLRDLYEAGAVQPFGWLKETLGLPDVTGRPLSVDRAAPAPGPPTLRAPSWLEVAEDRIRDLYESAAAQPLGQVADALGLTDLRGMAASAETPPPAVLYGTVDPVPTPRGLYSRVDEAAAKLLPKKGAHPNKVASILKSNASAEELAYRQVPEFLAGKGNATVTPGELQAHLAAHPAPVPQVKTLGGPNPSRPTGLPEGWSIQPLTGDRADRRFTLVNPEGVGQTLFAHDPAEALQEAIDWVTDAMPRTLPTKYTGYQLPGGEQYRETLLTLPPEMKKQGRYKVEIRNPEGEVVWSDMNVGATDIERLRQTHEGRWGGRTVHFEEHTTPVEGFRSGHFDEPNLLVHTRSNERVLPTGERGRFLEEVQSDWHQKGKQQGYGSTDPAVWKAAAEDLDRRGAALEAELRALGEGDTAQHRALREQIGALTDDYNAMHDRARYSVPDAPFKESWPDLALKQQILEAAEDPHAQWIGLTSGQTQAARYDLRKQIDELKWYRDGDGYRISAKKDGEILVQKTALSPQELSATLGKEMAEKITANPEQHGVMSGLDLQVGGEGMRKFYDELLPKRLEKILKPFGGTVERGAVATAPADVIGRYAAQSGHPFIQKQQEAAWIARLTPEMKARIRKEGLPLLVALLGTGATLGEIREAYRLVQQPEGEQ